MEPLREEKYAFYSFIAILFMVVGTLMLLYFEIFDTKRYRRIKNKYYFSYEIIHRRELKFLGRFAPKPIVRKPKTEDSGKEVLASANNENSSNSEVVSNDVDKNLPTQELRLQLKKRRPNR